MPLTRVQFEAEIRTGKVFYFSCPELNTNIPHYFVCVVRQPDDIIVLSCCTSQFETVKRLIEMRRFPYETLIFMSAGDPQNPFIYDTYINCNEYFPYSVQEFWEMYQDGEIQIIGEIPDDSIEQILIGFRSSPVIEQELKLLLP